MSEMVSPRKCPSSCSPKLSWVWEWEELPSKSSRQRMQNVPWCKVLPACWGHGGRRWGQTSTWTWPPRTRGWVHPWLMPSGVMQKAGGSFFIEALRFHKTQVWCGCQGRKVYSPSGDLKGHRSRSLPLLKRLAVRGSSLRTNINLELQHGSMILRWSELRDLLYPHTTLQCSLVGWYMFISKVKIALLKNTVQFTVQKKTRYLHSRTGLEELFWTWGPWMDFKGPINGRELCVKLYADMCFCFQHLLKGICDPR